MTLCIAVGKRIMELINEKDISQYRLAKNTCLDYKNKRQSYQQYI